MLPGATPLKGGVPLVSGGQVVGAVGISGLLPQQDHQVAEAGAATVK
ncbi:heme-binding protein [Rhizobiaceae sp. 2RAB30]